MHKQTLRKDNGSRWIIAELASASTGATRYPRALLSRWSTTGLSLPRLDLPERSPTGAHFQQSSVPNTHRRTGGGHRPAVHFTGIKHLRLKVPHYLHTVGQSPPFLNPESRFGISRDPVLVLIPEYPCSPCRSPPLLCVFVYTPSPVIPHYCLARETLRRESARAGSGRVFVLWRERVHVLELVRACSLVCACARVCHP